jgi:hypothetical protein
MMKLQAMRHDAATDSPLTLADELVVMACYASELEQALSEVQAVLSAIDLGELLTTLPPADEPGDRDRHNAATSLLAMLQRQLQTLEDVPRTDLSILLRVMASEAKKGGLSAG